MYIAQCNAVFEIILAYIQSQDWKKSFCEVIPQRKLAGDEEFESSSSQSPSIKPLSPTPTTYSTNTPDSTAVAGGIRTDFEATSSRHSHSVEFLSSTQTHTQDCCSIGSTHTAVSAEITTTSGAGGVLCSSLTSNVTRSTSPVTSSSDSALSTTDSVMSGSAIPTDAQTKTHAETDDLTSHVMEPNEAKVLKKTISPTKAAISSPPREHCIEDLDPFVTVPHNYD